MGIHSNGITNLNGIPWPVIIKSVLTLSVISIIWHRYVLDNNFVAWKLTGIDTLIPFLFAILQCFLALTVTSESITSFAFWVCSLNVAGIFAYWQIISRFERPHARLLYQQHYGAKEGEEIYQTMRKYFSDSLWTLTCTSAISGFFCLVIASGLYSAGWSLFMVTIGTIGIVGWLFIYDSHASLKKWFMLGAASHNETTLLLSDSTVKNRRSVVDRAKPKKVK